MSQIDLAKWLEWIDQTAKMFAEASQPERTYTEVEVRERQAEDWEKGWSVGYRRGAGITYSPNGPYDDNPYIGEGQREERNGVWIHEQHEWVEDE